MSTFDLSTEQIVYRAKADTDYTILILDGEAIALVEDADSEVIGYYQTIDAGHYVYNQYEGYSYYVADGALHSMRGRPDDMIELDVNDGNQKMAERDGDVAGLVG